MLRTRLYGHPQDRFLHHLILDSCRRFSGKPAIFDTSSNRRLSYAEYGETVEALARGLVAAGLEPGGVLAILLSDCGVVGRTGRHRRRNPGRLRGFAGRQWKQAGG